MNRPALVVVVGGGVAGLCCAHRLHQSGVPFVLLEADEGPGGRVQTDRYGGFLLDRGFQVLLTAYPEARRHLDYKKLDLRTFTPGSLVRSGGEFHRLVDPWRQPFKGLSSLFSPVGSFTDKLRIAKLRSKVCRGSLEYIFQAADRSTLSELRQLGFSEKMIDQFFMPFLGGVFLDRELETSSRMLNFVFRMFSQGSTAVPAEGMGQIAKQLASGLPKGSMRYGCRVRAVTANTVWLEDGTHIESSAIVLATGGEATASLLGLPFNPSYRRSVTCIYFSAPEPPTQEPILVLNGEGAGPVNNLCVPSLVSRHYAPPGQHLISTSILGGSSEDALEAAVRQQMHEWYGSQVTAWKHLRTYRITEALPNQPTGQQPLFHQGKSRPGLYLCGDFCLQGSLNAAMYSGRSTAEEIARDLATILV